MTISRKHQRHIEAIADNTLSTFAEIAASAKSTLNCKPPSSRDVLASVNTFTGYEALQSLDTIQNKLRVDLITLSQQPAIARIVASDSAGKRITYYICRAAPPYVSIGGSKLASYRSQVGRLASLPVGSEFELRTPNGVIHLEVLERALLHPSLVDQDWDSVNSMLEGHEYGPVTVISFRTLLRPTLTDEQDSTLLNRLLAEERSVNNILDGIRRSVIIKMELRDQPVLDQYQDEIFRLPLDSRLMLLGPPGTGKTTTLIRRLGQKLDPNGLAPIEHAMIQRASSDDALAHEQS